MDQPVFLSTSSMNSFTLVLADTNSVILPTKTGKGTLLAIAVFGGASVTVAGERHGSVEVIIGVVGFGDLNFSRASTAFGSGRGQASGIPAVLGGAAAVVGARLACFLTGAAAAALAVIPSAMMTTGAPLASHGPKLFFLLQVHFALARGFLHGSEVIFGRHVLLVVTEVEEVK